MKCHHPSADGTGEIVHHERVYKCGICGMRFIHRRGDDGFDYLIELGKGNSYGHETV